MVIKKLKEKYPLIYLAALRNQELQGNAANPEMEIQTEASAGNFQWGDTKEGDPFWDCIYNEHFLKAGGYCPELMGKTFYIECNHEGQFKDLGKFLNREDDVAFDDIGKGLWYNNPDCSNITSYKGPTISFTEFHRHFMGDFGCANTKNFIDPAHCINGEVYRAKLGKRKIIFKAQMYEIFGDPEDTSDWDFQDSNDPFGVSGEIEKASEHEEDWLQRCINAGTIVPEKEGQSVNKWNKWYKGQGKLLVYCSGPESGYGFNVMGNWFERPGGSWDMNDLLVATTKEVEERLIEEAKKLYPVGTVFEPAHVGTGYSIVTTTVYNFGGKDSVTALLEDFLPFDETNRFGNHDNMRNVWYKGKWAKKLKVTTDMFKVGKLYYNKEENIYAYYSGLTKSGSAAFELLEDVGITLEEHEIPEGYTPKVSKSFWRYDGLHENFIPVPVDDTVEFELLIAGKNYEPQPAIKEDCEFPKEQQDVCFGGGKVVGKKKVTLHVKPRTEKVQSAPIKLQVKKTIKPIKVI